MKKLLAAIFLSLFAVQLCLLPIAAQGTPCPSAVTLPATEVSVSSATLNGSVVVPLISGNAMQKGVLPASMQFTTGNGYYFRVLVSFQYGVEPGVYIRETPQVQILQSGNVQIPVSDLLPCSNQYYRIKLHTIVPEPALFDQYAGRLQGAGVGLDSTQWQKPYSGFISCPDYFGSELSFKTTCPFANPGSGGSSGGTGATSSGTTNMSNIVVQSATIANTRVSPGEKVDVAASVTNKGGSNGTSRVTVYINGQEAESKGIALSSGQSTTMNFSVSRNDPGTYTVLVNGVPAGSFTVDLFTNNDALIYGIIALFTIGIIGVLYLVIKRRTA
jgi:hypothetical protein